jgi:phenylacetate-CoA ligase
MALNRTTLSPFIEKGASIWPISQLFGLVSAYLAYPLAEKIEKRTIRTKLAELRRFYRLPIQGRRQIAQDRLVQILEYSRAHVPYYRDLFHKISFDPLRVAKDPRYLEAIPFLTKEIIREQGERLLAFPLQDVRHHVCKTGGSTGLSALFYYDQDAADYAAAVTLYARECIGKVKTRSELHFACRFPDTPVLKDWFTREDFKCFAMNRTNIFFDRLDDVGLAEIWQILKRRKPYLVHAHPSTIYALACFVQKQYGTAKAFDVFESSGELLEPHQREMITKALRCDVIDRYGLAELGVMAYQVGGSKADMQVFDSEGYAESRVFDVDGEGFEELIFTGYRNYLMPLIRYRTGDLGHISKNPEGTFLTNVVGRIHDQVPIHGVNHATHHIQDILDHKVGQIQEFQIDLRTSPPKLRIVPERAECIDAIKERINQFWGASFELEFIGHEDLIRVGRHAKFRHVVHP